MHRYAFILSCLIFSTIMAVPVLAESGLEGTWELNQAASDSVKNKISGLASKRKKGFNKTRERDRRRAEELGARGREQQLGPLLQILSAESLHIEGEEKIKLTFDGKFIRSLIPNRYGRVFSASGKELVQDEFGHTMSYWDSGSLVVETMIASGGVVVERYKLNEASTQLAVSISIKTLQSASIKLSKVYERNAN